MEKLHRAVVILPQLHRAGGETVSHPCRWHTFLSAMAPLSCLRRDFCGRVCFPAGAVQTAKTELLSGTAEYLPLSLPVVFHSPWANCYPLILPLSHTHIHTHRHSGAPHPFSRLSPADEERGAQVVTATAPARHLSPSIPPLALFSSSFDGELMSSRKGCTVSFTMAREKMLHSN